METKIMIMTILMYIAFTIIGLCVVGGIIKMVTQGFDHFFEMLVFVSLLVAIIVISKVLFFGGMIL
jgi:hypothetical protein